MRVRPAGSIDAVTALDRIAACGVIPVVQPPAGSRAVELAAALAEAGLPCLEITFRAEGAPDAIERIRAAVPAMLVGAGTVLSVTQGQAAVDAGAEFLISPGTNPDVVALAQRAGIPILPGVATPTEIEANLARGLEVMKLFPAEVVGGVRFLKAVFGPYRAVRFLPTGGIDRSNLADYLRQPNVIACGGTWIVPVDVLEADDFATIAARAREAAEIVRAIRDGSPAAAG
jgi:2-dehydro-3-deoxyphosphogluconate aldolase/(4S)-4-hydroxy-2-oxoglutarate aldolase